MLKSYNHHVLWLAYLGRKEFQMDLKGIKKENIKLTVLDKDENNLNDEFLSVTLSKCYLNKLILSMITMKNSDCEMAEKITQREKEILSQIAEGKDNEEIGETMSISEHTVKAHIKNIFQKLEVNDRTKAVVKAIRYNLIDVYTA